MGTVDAEFARRLRDELDLTRAVETGTYRGLTARVLASVFHEVITIELDERLAGDAALKLRDVEAIRVLQGGSGQLLRDVRDPEKPTLYFLDAHWSAGMTAGRADPCPLLAELAAISGGHADDCVIVDDARLFAYAPPPPHRPEEWPELASIFGMLAEQGGDRVVTVVADQIIAIPRRAKAALDEYGVRSERLATELSRRLKPIIGSAMDSRGAMMKGLLARVGH
jgi:hypothetical protein